MRRSKSNPAKYARNYRTISQRKMTIGRHNDDDGGAAATVVTGILDNDDDITYEIKKMKNEMLKSENKIINNESSSSGGGGRAADELSAKERKKRKMELKRRRAGDDDNCGDDGSDDDDGGCKGVVVEVQGEMEEMMKDNPDFLLPSKKKVKKEKKPEITLTDREIKEAKKLRKNYERKLKQLEERRERKLRRSQIYETLNDNALTAEQLNLLKSSSRLGKKESKREKLRMIVKRRDMGLGLTEEEEDLLYSGGGRRKEGDGMEVEEDGEKEVLNRYEEIGDDMSDDDDEDVESDDDSDKKEEGNDENKDKKNNKNNKNDADKTTKPKPSNTTTTKDTPPASASSIAASLMANLTQLKTTPINNPTPEPTPSPTPPPPTKKYTPTTPTPLVTAHTLNLPPTKKPLKLKKTNPLTPPPSIAPLKSTLPVSTMEYEIMDAILSHDVTIIRGDTGSGKSTQVPQMLYEYGYCPVGVTQPRRVAAVSVAKRVSVEMGCGGIEKSKKGVVSYRTRYDSAGWDPCKTQVSFMTDGILLNEIRRDMLLRQYNAIVLDEAHERNLNTDVLIGLLTRTLRLRKEASAEEGGLKMLKLVIMSATLRVEDFVGGDEGVLFDSMPKVVTIPGRSFPVTIHHSKVTELEDYEGAAFKKILKIHDTLPDGGILVFMTGKQEIHRMVKRLRQAIGKADGKSGGGREANEEDDDYDDMEEAKDTTTTAAPSDDITRELDDDEIDADNYSSSPPSTTPPPPPPTSQRKPALILPLHSQLPPSSQSLIFKHASTTPNSPRRLIIIATNVAETSLTIPSITYVVDTGRRKHKTHHPLTGLTSYDISWIAKSNANQRAGRAGRTGPGHCYRLYSSAVYDRMFKERDDPEVLTRPLEDVLLSMKDLGVTNVMDFPFVTHPDKGRMKGGLKLLERLGCLEGDNKKGVITPLGRAAVTIPLGVRFAVMLIVAAKAGVLDYAIGVVSVLSEQSPFVTGSDERREEEEDDEEDEKGLDEVDKNRLREQKRKTKKRKRWHHDGGDILASLAALGAYTYATVNNKDQKTFCTEHGLNPTILHRAQKLRHQLARVCQSKLSYASDSSVAASMGTIAKDMKPPSSLQELYLKQAITSGFLDHLAMLAPPGSIPNKANPHLPLRNAYVSCLNAISQPLFISVNSVLHEYNPRHLPPVVCYDSIIKKTNSRGEEQWIMTNVTPVDVSWLGPLSRHGSPLLKLTHMTLTPLPIYDAKRREVLFAVGAKFGERGWDIPPLRMSLREEMERIGKKTKEGEGELAKDESYRWFARYLLEGKVIPFTIKQSSSTSKKEKTITSLWNDNPCIITRRKASKKVMLLISELSRVDVDDGNALRKYWAEKNDKFLFKNLKAWTKSGEEETVKRMWMVAVKREVEDWRRERKE